MKPSDVKDSATLRERIKGVRAFRANSDASSTRAAASTPNLFRQLSQPTTPYLCIPRHVSEARPYFLAARFGPEVITSDANFLTTDKDGFMFAIVSSTMFITWQRTVGGRLKSDLRFNKLLTWNTFPLPSVDSHIRSAIIEAGLGIVAARNHRPDLSLADQYGPSSISSELLHAHQTLDREVDKAFGLKSRGAEMLERQDCLFDCYQSLVQPPLAVAAKRKTRK